MVTVGRHAGLRRDSGTVALIPLHVALVSQSLLRVHGHIWHVVSWHGRVLGHSRSIALRREMLVGRLFGRVDLITSVDTVLVAWSGLRCVKTRLQKSTR